MGDPPQGERGSGSQGPHSACLACPRALDQVTNSPRLGRTQIPVSSVRNPRDIVTATARTACCRRSRRCCYCCARASSDFSVDCGTARPDRTQSPSSAAPLGGKGCASCPCCCCCSRSGGDSCSCCNPPGRTRSSG